MNKKRVNYFFVFSGALFCLALVSYCLSGRIIEQFFRFRYLFNPKLWSWKGTVRQLDFYSTILTIMGLSIFSFALFKDSKKLRILGVSICVISMLLESIYKYYNYNIDFGNKPIYNQVLYYWAIPVMFIILLIAVIVDNKASLYLGIAAAVIVLLSVFIDFWVICRPNISLTLDSVFLSPFRALFTRDIRKQGLPITFIRVYLYPIASVLLGIGLYQKTIPAVIEMDSRVNSINKLTKLKELLDKGIITQEEFEEKKKQLIGL